MPTPVTGLTVGAAYDYRWMGSSDNSRANYQTAAALYVSYQATEKLKFNNRAEYAAASYGTVFPTGFAIPARQNDEVLADTFTVDYSLWANVITRAEFRVDHYLDGGPGAFGGNGVKADTLDKNALSLALNVIYKF